MNFLVWKFYAIYNKYCYWRLKAFSPELISEITSYMQGSDTTGTKYSTLWNVIKLIKIYKPLNLLESGTGLSTVVIAHTLKKLMDDDKSYQPKFISMESVENWYKQAVKNLPSKYSNTVDIIHGPREKYESFMFRGYAHSNIPALNYDFIFLDGPSYIDDDGPSFSADILKILDLSNAKVVRGVIDTRVSSCFVLQTLYGTSAVRYFPILRTTHFTVNRCLIKKANSDCFSSNIFGRLTVKLDSVSR